MVSDTVEYLFEALGRHHLEVWRDVLSSTGNSQAYFSLSPNQKKQSNYWISALQPVTILDEGLD